MGSEKFCLRWNDFESNISCSLRELRECQEFLDVTLACGDDQIQAHKVILSACSPFFRKVLLRNPHQHPLLYLKGVRITDLQSVLQFMYWGEVNVAQEELNTFLSLAEELQVKGLTQSNNKADNKKENAPLVKNTAQVKSGPKHKTSTAPFNNELVPTTKPSPPTIPQKSSSCYNDASEDIQEIIPVKSEPNDFLPVTSSRTQDQTPTCDIYETQPSGQAVANVDEQTMYQEESYDDYEHYEVEQEYTGGQILDNSANKGNVQDMLVVTETIEGKTAWKCLVCGKNFSHKHHGKRHIETVHCEAPSYECEVCGSILKNKNSYQKHISVTHGIKKRPLNANMSV